MKRIFFTQLLLLFTICQAFTQDLRFFKIIQPSNGYLCEGQRFIIAYRKTGNFDAGNKMYLNILNASEQLLQKVETKDSSGFLVGIMPDLYKITNAPTHLNVPDVGIKLQLSSSLPLISSNILEDYFRLAALPKLSLVERSLNVYSGSECILQLEGTGSLPLTLKTSDGSTLEYSNVSYGSYKIDIPFYPQKTGKYYTQVTNFCGDYGVSGSVDVVVNDNFISMVGLPQIELCVGGMVKLPIMKRGVWNQDNKFLIRFTNKNNSKQFYEIESQEVANFLNAQIPTNIPIGLYTMSVQSSSPKVSSVNQLDIRLKGFTNVDLIPDNVEVVYGKSLILRYQTSGLLPVNFQLNDGTTSDETQEGESAIMVKPLKTTEYKVADFHNFCTSGVGKNIVNVKVLDGIITEKVLTNSVCEGGKFKVLISSQPKYSAGQTLYLSVKFDDDSKILLTGKMNEEGIVEFEFPRNSIHAGKNFRFLVQANSQNTNVSNYDSGLYLFNRTPLVKALTPLYNTQILEKPNWVTYYLEVNGGGLLTVENNMGEKWTEDVSNSKVFSKIGKFFVSSDTTFSISKVSNECGSFPNSNVNFKVTVKSSLAGIRLKTPFERGSTICVGSKFTLEIERWGKLTQPADAFLDYVNEDGVITKEGVGEFIGDKLVWTVPSIPLNATIYLQVRLQSPLFGTVIAERIPLKIDTPPIYNGEKELFGRTQYGKTFPNTLYIENTSPITLLLDSGMEIFEKNPQNTILSVDSTKSSTFIIKTITNFCGKLDANISIHTTRFTKAISLSNLVTNKVGYVCVGQKIPVEFQESIGTFAFKLQESVPSTYKLILIDINSYKTLYTLEKGIMSTKFDATVPLSVKEGYYYFQIVDENDTLITSERRYIGVLGPPSVSVTTSFPMTGSTLQRGEEIRISSKTAYQLPYYGLINDANGKVYQLSNTNSLYRTYANASTTYSIKSFYNECGIQDLNFSANITVKPAVRWQAYGANFAHEYCRFDKLLVNISPIGQLDTTKYFTLTLVSYNNPTQSKYPLAKVKPSGFQYLSFPENLPAGIYYLSMSASDDTPISFEPFTLSVLDLPKVRIVGSALTMENAPIYVKLVCEDGEKASYHGKALYELSNGDKGDFNNERDYYTYTYKSYNKSEVLTIKNISNYCGVGTALGSVNITTYPSTNQAIYTENPINAASNFQICAGKDYSISYSNFTGDTTTSKFSLEMSDNQGHNFKPIPFISHQKLQHIIKFKMPEDVTLGGYYRFRIINNVVGYSSAISTVPMELHGQLSATFDTTHYSLEGYKPVALRVLLKGTFPIGITVGKDSLTARQYSATTNPYLISVSETSPTAYKIFQVENSVCGIGSTGKYPSVSIGLVTGFEDIQKLGVTVGPNPATDFITIYTDENGIKAELVDSIGNVVSEIKLNAGSTQLDLKNYPNGIYLLRISKDQKVGVFKLMKY